MRRILMAPMGAAALVLATFTTAGSPAAAMTQVSAPMLRAADAVDQVVVSDRLDRTLTEGWGTADTGGTYLHSGAASYSVGKGYGTVVLPRGGAERSATLPNVAVRDGRVTVDLAMRDLPTAGTGIYHSVHLRQGGAGSYRATLLVPPSGTASVSVARVNGSGSLVPLGSIAIPGTVQPHKWFTMAFSVTGEDNVQLQAKAWPRGSAEPSWQVTASDSSSSRVTDPGAFRLTTYASSSGPGTTAYYDSLSLVSTTPALSTPPVPAVEVGSPGADPVGQAEYAVPADGIFVAPGGSDSNAGTAGGPLATVAEALRRASAGGTVVLRGGTYHQRFTITKQVTLQNYPGEAVWFDGSVLVSGFASDGGLWIKDGWTTTFDASASFTRGSNAGGFLNPSYPMAAHPDQVWIDGVSQRQVGSRAEVAGGTFYVDKSAQRLYLGTDPNGRSVRASTIGRAIEVRADNSVLRGFGVRRYAPSLPDMGTVTVERPGVTVENLHLVDNSTVGISLLAADITARRLTVQGNGLLGIHGNHSDRLRMEHILSSGNNNERFNQSPVSGGIKITRARDVVLDRATLHGNIGPGYWLDESVRHGVITNSVMHNNAGHGMSLELSDDMTVVGNVIRDNGRFGVKINNTSTVRVWNNTVVRNDRPINIVQDARRGSDLSTPGHDPRYPGALSWINGPVDVHNNVLSARTGICLMCVEDYSKEFTAEQLGVTTNHNVYQRDTSTSPQYVAVWSRGAGNPAVYSDLPAFRTGTGQETTSLYLLGTPAADAEGRVTAAVVDAAGSTAAPLSAELADLIGVPEGSRMLGAGL
jgi:trimeric autotransporter adhesin